MQNLKKNLYSDKNIVKSNNFERLGNSDQRHDQPRFLRTDAKKCYSSLDGKVKDQSTKWHIFIGYSQYGHLFYFNMYVCYKDFVFLPWWWREREADFFVHYLKIKFNF